MPPIAAKTAFQLVPHVDHEDIPADCSQKPIAVHPHPMTAKSAPCRQLHLRRQVRRGQIKTTFVVGIVDPRRGVRHVPVMFSWRTGVNLPSATSFLISATGGLPMMAQIRGWKRQGTRCCVKHVSSPSFARCRKEDCPWTAFYRRAALSLMN